MNEKCNGLEQALNGICSERAAERRSREDFSFRESDEERARKLDALKEQVRAGLYKPDIKDIARLLTSALNQRI